MRRWFLSYTSPDNALAQALKTALQHKDSGATIFFAPEAMRAGGFWQQQLADEIAKSTAFVLLVGETGVGSWQVMEYYEALDRHAKEPHYPLILVVSDKTAKRTAPGLPFVRQLHWVLTDDPASEATIGKLIDAASGAATRPGELWRHTAPYRGLAAMTQADSEFFFGRERNTVEVIRALESASEKLPVLLGNSGVGKSSLAQAGVLAALARQAWPEKAKDIAGEWPVAFRESRRWCFLSLRPGPEPLRSLVEPFLRTWQFEATDPLWAKRLVEWSEALDGGRLGLRDLLSATEARYGELHQPMPPAFFLYIDQGEQLYVRAQESQRRRFSEILAQGVADPRLHAMMSFRADFFGDLQKDEALCAVHRQINVLPLRKAELGDVVSRPAELLSARFENDHLAADIARSASEESVKDAGALTLVSYLLDDMWRRMIERGDGVLRLPAAAIDLGGVLAERANAFIADHPNSQDKLRRIFTLKLATVREGEEPTRRRASRSEFSDEEWRLVSELADHPNRLLVTATPGADATPLIPQAARPDSDATPASRETYAEVAHEAIFRRWDKLRDWIAAEREFLRAAHGPCAGSGAKLARKTSGGHPAS